MTNLYITIGILHFIVVSTVVIIKVKKYKLKVNKRRTSNNKLSSFWTVTQADVLGHSIVILGASLMWPVSLIGLAVYGITYRITEWINGR